MFIVLSLFVIITSNLLACVPLLCVCCSCAIVYYQFVHLIVYFYYMYSISRELWYDCLPEHIIHHIFVILSECDSIGAFVRARKVLLHPHTRTSYMHPQINMHTYNKTFLTPTSWVMKWVNLHGTHARTHTPLHIRPSPSLSLQVCKSWYTKTKALAWNVYKKKYILGTKCTQ